MDMPRNTLKAALLEGRTQIGLWSSINDAAVVEMLAGCGYDWLMIDTEHAAIDTLDVLPLLQAAAPYPTQMVVRPKAVDVADIKRLLDLGAQTLLVPYIRDVEEARLAVSAVAYGPHGVRGMAGLTRASRFGAVRDYARRAREEICLILQIETADALDAVEDIAAVEGVDALFIGPADLAASMGHPGEPSHPAVRKACVEGVRRIRAAGKPAGFLTLDPEVTAEVAEAGANFLAVDVDAAILRRGAVEALARWRR